MEEWRDINGYEGILKVSNCGIVLKNNYFVNPYTDKDGYKFIMINKKRLSIHRLVAFAFPEICGEHFEGAEVNHKNEIKEDNRAENLEWVTHKSNCNYGTRNKRIIKNRNKSNKEKEVIQYDLEGNLIKCWVSLRSIEKETPYNNSNICRCCNGKQKYAYGYIWKYKGES